MPAVKLTDANNKPSKARNPAGKKDNNRQLYIIISSREIMDTYI